MNDVTIPDAQPVAHQFLLVMVDNPATGELEVGGTQQPIEFNPNSPAHIVGRFIKDNLAQIIEVARQEALLGARLAAPAPIESRQLVLPASQTGLVSGGSSVIQVDGAGVASQGVGHGQA